MLIRYRILLLVAAVFLVFSPSLSGKLITGDDEDLFARLEKQESWQLEALFAQSSSRIYFRPLVGISYQIDKFWWHLDKPLMHFENILLHILNTLLVFFITSRFLSPGIRSESWIPFVVALLFGLNPVASESVNWLSGRTDLLAATFVLSSAMSLLIFLETRRYLFFAASLILYFAGFLSKEVSVTFLLGIICIFGSYLPADRSRKNFIQKLPNTLWFFFWILTIPAGLLVVNYIAGLSNTSKLSLTNKIILNDLWYSLFVCLRALGFYIKKIFWPFPLNFAILEVDPLYELFGIVVVIFCLYLLWKRTALGALFLTGIFLIVPSFLLAFNQIAWTPYAERYVYLPSAFILSATTIYFGRFVEKRKFSAACIATAILLFWGGSAFARSQIWMTNLTLWEDTTRKSPLCAAAWNDYGVALHKDGQLDKAIDAFKQAATIHQLGYQETYDLNMANVFLAQGRYDTAKKTYSDMYAKSKGRSTRALDAWKELLERQVAQADNPAEKESLEAELKDLPTLVKNKNGMKVK